jgi:pimeloyl-ACP methyl ester carboxylesterase
VTDQATVVLVHGAWHGAWCWNKVVRLLDAAKVPNVAVELPLTSLADDVTATRRAIENVSGPVVLCGHSYGGIVITEGGAHPRVRHLVYLCAFAIDVGRSAADAVDDDLPSTDFEKALVFAEDGSVSIDRDGARRGFYLDCEPADADDALDGLRPIALECLTTRTTTAAWADRPSTYAVCTSDEAIHPALQRVLAGHCTDVVEWPTSHSPFLSQPSRVADLLVDLSR